MHSKLFPALALSFFTLAPLSAHAKTSLADCTKRIKADKNTVKAELKMVTLAPAGSQWAKELQAWSDEALQESDCQLAVRWYWNGGGGGDELRMVADLRQGQKHGAAMTAVGLSEIYKEVLIFQLPGLFENWPALDGARAAEKTYFEAEFEKRGFVIVGWGDVGATKVLSVGAEIKTPADFKGKTAWHLPGDIISPTFFTKVGMKSSPMSLGELGSHLGKDIQVLVISPYAAEQLQLTSKITNVTVLTPAFAIGAIVVKKEKLDSIPKELREIFVSTGKKYTEALTNTIRNQDAQALNRLKTSKAAYTPSAAEQEQWKNVAAEVRKSLRGAPFNPEVFDRVVKK